MIRRSSVSPEMGDLTSRGASAEEKRTLCWDADHPLHADVRCYNTRE